MSKRARMLVFQDGSILGTVGGGILEADVIQQARYILKHRQPSQVIGFDLTSEQIEADGLTCGGTVEILLELFSPEMDMAVLQEMEQVYFSSKTAVSATLLPDGDRSQRSEKGEFAPVKFRKLLFCEDGSITGTFGHPTLDTQVIDMARSRIGQACFETVEFGLSSEESRAGGLEHVRVFFESILPAPTAYVFGGGHVSLSLSKILHFIEFEYVVLDDRQEFVTHERFPDAKNVICHEFDHVFDRLDLSAHSSYIIIVTRGHKSDLVVLEQALHHSVKYIGMIGSTRKVKLLLDDLRQRGVPAERLEQVHAPIGLEIYADTPEEIAISIAAEIIKVWRSDM